MKFNHETHTFDVNLLIDYVRSLDDYQQAYFLMRICYLFESWESTMSATQFADLLKVASSAEKPEERVRFSAN